MLRISNSIVLCCDLFLQRMAFLLNYGEFYERLRDLLENNHPVSKYKFGNKVNGAMKDFDNFLDNTVKKYMDAFNAIQFAKAENVELRVLIDRLKKEIRELHTEEDFLRLHLEEKDAKCHEISRQKDRLYELYLYVTHDNPILVEAKRLKCEVQRLKEENCQLRAQAAHEISRIQEQKQEMLQERRILEEQLNKWAQDCRQQQSKLQLQVRLAQQDMALKLSEERRALHQNNARQEAAWKREMQALQKKKELWKKKYYEEVGFVALTEEGEDSLNRID